MTPRRLLVLTALTILSLLRPGDADRDDLAKLQGDWQMVSSSRDGTALPAESVKAGKRVCKDNTTTVTVGDMLIMKADFKLDAAKNPKTIDYDVKAGPYTGKKQLGIYKIENDQATFSFSPPEKPRPDDFKSDPGDERTLSVWKKIDARGR